MGYRHIDNLYKNQTILEFRSCYAMEKVHGTSAHIRLERLAMVPILDPVTGLPVEQTPEVRVIYFAGGATHLLFVTLFDEADLKKRFLENNYTEITIYGEAYGGKMQGMRDTYGDKLLFIAFEVEMGEKFLSVESADYVVQKMGLEFVPYRKISTDLASLDAERDLPSRVAVRRGILEPKIAEGVVLRPPLEVLYPSHDGGPYGRILAKHKRSEFSERASKRDSSSDPEKALVLTKAKDIANEWVTEMRLGHVLDKIPKEGKFDMTHMRAVIRAMQEDVVREAKGEIIESKEALAAIATRTALLFKSYLTRQLVASVDSILGPLGIFVDKEKLADLESRKE